MIDIHAHIIPLVDDGSPSIETSIKLIRNEIVAGITDIICTPHYRRGMYIESKENILKRFKELVDAVKKENLNVNLFLGNEIYIVDTNSLKKYLNENVIFSMNNSEYYLFEFSYTNYIDISEVVYNASLLGKKIIVAHIERYEYIGIDEVHDIIDAGGLIQVNASSIAGKNGSRIKKKTMNYIKNGLIHFVASDTHSNRENYFEKAYKIVYNKFGSDKAKALFNENAKILFER